MNLNNKNAIITGGSKGLGKAIALALASEGYNIYICARNLAALTKTKNEIIEKFPNIAVHTFEVDMSSKEEVIDFAHQIKSITDKINVLVNNAGVFLPGLISEEEDGILEKMIDTNLYSAYYLTKELMPLIKNAETPHIFNMCSIASKIAYPNGGSYSISKFALLGFSKVLREELKSQQIKVTAILPGATWSDSWSGVDLPVERLMQATDIAEVVISALRMSPSAVVEEIIIRPTLGDL